MSSNVRRESFPCIARALGGALTLAAALSLAAPVSASPPGAHAPGSGSVPARDGSGTLWLCRPGSADNPCTADRTATAVGAHGNGMTIPSFTFQLASRFDCFYVYPTVSTARADNAPIKVTPAETAVARLQASRFSQVCNVWAPVYAQRTTQSLARGLGADPAADAVAYHSVLSAWQDYRTHFNDGRPVIFIGHSQGAAMLIRLLRGVVDHDAALRKRVVSAIILGGNVTVPIGKVVGSTFSHIPLCTSPSSLHCVIAYSSFPAEPPADADFGRAGQGVSLQSDQRATSGVEVACTNPATLTGAGAKSPKGSEGPGAPLDPYFTSGGIVLGTGASASPSTWWATYPGLYSARCEHAGGATWLQVIPNPDAVGQRPLVTEALGPAWGYHLDDMNLALGNLVSDVSAEERAYLGAPH